MPDRLAPIPRSKFLEVSLVGLAGALGGVLTLPVLGFMVLPSFTNLDEDEVDLGPVDNFPEGQYVIATFLAHPEQGEVSRRTTFVRNNGASESGEQSFTILYSRCVHLGCPVQPNGPIDEEARTGSRGRRRAATGARPVVRVPLSRGPVRRRGEPSGRPTRPFDGSLHVLDQERPARPR